MKSQIHFEDIYKKDIKQSKKISSGITRTVLQSKMFPNLVIKIEDLTYGDRYFQNIIEYTTWLEVEFTKWKKYFAPCHWISNDGTVLYMSKTEPLQGRRILNIPSILTDNHIGNYGKLKNKIVCHDYGMGTLCKIDRKGIKLKKQIIYPIRKTMKEKNMIQ